MGIFHLVDVIYTPKISSFMAWSFLDKAYKILVNKRATHTNKKPYEEFGDFTLDIHAQEVKAQPIALNDPAQAIVDGVATLYTLFVLTEDNTVPNQQSYYAFQTPDRLKNWIPDKYGANYAIKLYDNSNNQIFPTDASDWVFDYPTGILNFSGSTAGFAKPFKITGYRYTGQYLTNLTGGAKLKKQIIPIGSNGQTLFDLTVEIPEPVGEVFQVKVNGVPLRSIEWTYVAPNLTFVEAVALFQLETSDEFEVQYYPA